jgi:GDP-4-dehydro-6-deoxy-D-mannose reductase
MSHNALIVGGTGFVGYHMRKELEGRYRVVATGRSKDIRDEDLVTALVCDMKPDIVVNLAAVTTVRESFEREDETYAVGFIGTLNLLRALRAAHFRGRMLNISSSEIYGCPLDGELPVTEGAAVAPMSPYAVSKLAAESLCYQWARTEHFEIVTARPFTHIGPGQSDRFAISRFGKHIVEAEVGERQPVLHVGNLDSTRDLTDVRDVVRSYADLLDKGISGQVYNVCSNTEIAIGALLDQIIKIADTQIEILQDPALRRSSEQRRIRGSFDKLNQLTGWTPVISLEQTLRDILQYWRASTAEHRAQNVPFL